VRAWIDCVANQPDYLPLTQRPVNPTSDKV
jgi:hypothetical protein